MGAEGWVHGIVLVMRLLQGVRGVGQSAVAVTSRRHGSGGIVHLERAHFFVRLALDAPYEARVAEELDPFLGEEAVLPLDSEPVLLPLLGNPLPEGLVLGVVLGDLAGLVLGLVFQKLAVAVVPVDSLPDLPGEIEFVEPGPALGR